LWEVIWLHNVARNNKWLPYLVQKHNSESWLMECEILWLKILLKELEFDSKDFMRLYCDNKVAISIAHKSQSNPT
jgi:hypothetical protein